MSEPQPFTDDELAQARNAPLGWTARRWLATVDALRAALAAQPQPDELERLRAFHDRVVAIALNERADWHSIGWSIVSLVDAASAGSAAPTESDCTCVPGDGCDAEGDPGCRYCQVADSELPCPADDDAVAGS